MLREQPDEGWYPFQNIELDKYMTPEQSAVLVRGGIRAYIQDEASLKGACKDFNALTKVGEASAFVLEELRGGPQLSVSLYTKGEERGISRRTQERARTIRGDQPEDWAEVVRDAAAQRSPVERADQRTPFAAGGLPPGLTRLAAATLTSRRLLARSPRSGPRNAMNPRVPIGFF
jgi:hypothetical protein